MSILTTGGFINKNHRLFTMQQRNKDGSFKQIRKPFSLENFDDGYIDNRGRFRVWMPNHPRAYAEGYILRSIIAYEFYHGSIVPPWMDIHHIDGNRLNDTKENLKMLPHGYHSGISNEKKRKESDVARICKHCGKQFIIKQWRLKESSRGQYCSQICYHAHNRGKNHPNYNRVTTNCEYCKQPFEHIPSHKLRFCSNRCAAKYNWNKRRRH